MEIYSGGFVGCVSIAVKTAGQEKPTKLLGIRIVQNWRVAKPCNSGQIAAKAAGDGDVAEWLKATVC